MVRLNLMIAFPICEFWITIFGWHVSLYWYIKLLPTSVNFRWTIRYCCFTLTSTVYSLQPIQHNGTFAQKWTPHTHDDTSPTSEPHSETNTCTLSCYISVCLVLLSLTVRTFAYVCVSFVSLYVRYLSLSFVRFSLHFSMHSGVSNSETKTEQQHIFITYARQSPS